MKRTRAGFTLVELLLYMAVSGIVVIGMVTFLVRMFGARAVTATQSTVQESTASMLDQMSVAIRHGYQVEQDGNTLTVFSHPAAQPTDTIYTVFTHVGNQLVTGSNKDRSAIIAHAMHTPDVQVTEFSADPVDSAIVIHLKALSGSRTSQLDSTIAYRQTK